MSGGAWWRSAAPVRSRVQRHGPTDHGDAMVGSVLSPLPRVLAPEPEGHRRRPHRHSAGADSTDLSLMSRSIEFWPGCECNRPIQHGAAGCGFMRFAAKYLTEAADLSAWDPARPTVCMARF